MDTNANKALARVWFDEVMNGRDLSAIDRAYSPSYRYHGPHGTTTRGLAEAKAIVRMLWEAIPDRVSTVQQQLAEGPLVTTRWVSQGTNTGPLLGQPPTNLPVTVHGITISRIEEGKIVEDWEIMQIVHAEPDEG